MNVSFEFSAISPEAMAHLRSLAFSKTGTRRLCLHESEESKLHMMLIEIMPNTRFPEHEHSLSDELVFLLTGQLDYCFKDGSANSLSEISTRSTILPMGIPHSVVSGPEGALYLEIICGPFRA